MTLRFFEGPAGSGKTTLLMNELAIVLRQQPLAEHQRVLALTRMHGSRRRLDARLRDVDGLRRFECTTFDSLARRLVDRFRPLARTLAPGLMIDDRDFAARSVLAGRLLDEPFVRAWIAASYPIVIVDEFQDSKGGQLSMLRNMESVTTCLAAADAFQDLDGEDHNEPVEWARSRCRPETLSSVHRTQVTELLGAALALREGQAVPRDPSVGFRVVAHPPGLAAWELAVQVRRWSRLREIAVISPVSMKRSTFVRTVLTRVAEKPLGKQVPVGPYQIPWEDGSDTAAEALIAALGLPEEPEALVDLDSLVAAGRDQATLVKWAERRRSLTGDSRLTSGELRGHVHRLVHQQRAHSAVARRRLSAMTVHAAKNREFDAVAVLWPYEATTDQDRARRLLYNAITRARVAALVIVPNEKRLELPPFVEWGIARAPDPQQVGAQQIMWS